MKIGMFCFTVLAMTSAAFADSSLERDLGMLDPAACAHVRGQIAASFEAVAQKKGLPLDAFTVGLVYPSCGVRNEPCVRSCWITIESKRAELTSQYSLPVYGKDRMQTCEAQAAADLQQPDVGSAVVQRFGLFKRYCEVWTVKVDERL